jgi:glycosyltransferase involved in cell wall biosynthesis/SAM-dependent methyltransferase
MRVIFSTPTWVISGVNSFTLNLMRKLQRLGHEVELLVVRQGEPDSPELPLPTDVSVQLLDFDRNASCWKSRWEALIVYLNQRAPCIYIPNYDFDNSSVAPCLDNRVGIVGIVHSDDPHHYEHLLRLGRYWNGVIAVSSYLLEAALTLDPSIRGRAFHVSYGVPHPQALPLDPARGGKTLRIVYSGRFFEEQKRVSDLPKIARLLADRSVPVHWTLIGNGPEEHSLLDGFADLEASSSAEFTGPLTNDEVLPVYARHDCFILTSNYEGLPVALLEAMAQGAVPVVTDIQSGIPDVIRQGKNGYAVPVGDIGAFVNLLTRLQSDVTHRQALSSAAFETISSGGFSIDAVASRYVEVFEFVRCNIETGTFTRPRAIRPGSWTGDVTPPPHLQISPDDYYQLKWTATQALERVREGEAQWRPPIDTRTAAPSPSCGPLSARLLSLREQLSLRANPVVWPPVEHELKSFLKYCHGITLNAGSGQRGVTLGQRDLTIDIDPLGKPHVIGDVHSIPLLDESVDTILSVAVLEHTQYPWLVTEEFFRVLRPSGHAIIAVPFLQPQHACPNDFVRFTENGLVALAKYAGFEVIETAHVHHFGQTLAWLLWEYICHNRPSLVTRAVWLALIKQLSKGRLLGADSPNTHNTHYIVIRKPGAIVEDRPYYRDAIARGETRDWFFPLLACPHTRQTICVKDGALLSEDGKFRYHFQDGIPELLPRGDILSVVRNGLRKNRRLASASDTQSVRALTAPKPAWTPRIKSDTNFDVIFRRGLLERLRHDKPDRVAFLVSSEYEGIFHNGGVGTHYRTLSQHLAEEGWYVILLLTYTDQAFGGHSDLAAIKQVFSTKDVGNVLNLQPLHQRLFDESRSDVYDHEGLCALFFAQAITNCFPDTPVYIEFAEMMGTGHRTIQARRAGLLGQNCVTAVTMHSGHEWVFEANEKYTDDDPARLWQVCFYERSSFENADIVFFPSHFLKNKVESFGWNTGRAVHMPYFAPVVDLDGPARNDLPTVNEHCIPVVFFGRLEERKGLCTFVEAVKALEPRLQRDIHLVFVGKVVPLYSAPLRHLDSRAYLDRELPGIVPYSVVPDLYSVDAIRYVNSLESPVVCLTSPQENFPNSALEMGQLPLRLVVSDNGGFHETLDLIGRSSGLYWFEPKNPRALSEAIARALREVGEPPKAPSRREVIEVNRGLLGRKQGYIREALDRAALPLEQKPQVTVGIIWNEQHRHLMDCLHSIKIQGYSTLDVLILDNRATRNGKDGIAEGVANFEPRYVRPDRVLCAGAARNFLAGRVDGDYILTIDADSILVPFAVEKLVTMAIRTEAAVVSAPELGSDPAEPIAGPAGAYIPGLIRGADSGKGFSLVSIQFVREFGYLEEEDADTEGTEIIWAALATGARVAYYPYPLGERRRETSTAGALDHGSRLKSQYRMRQYLAQIPPSRWSRRQLHMLLTAIQQLQAHPSADAPSLTAETLRLQTELNWTRCRIAAMESSKFWKLRHRWFRVKRALRLSGWETE